MKNEPVLTSVRMIRVMADDVSLIYGGRRGLCYFMAGNKKKIRGF